MIESAIATLLDADDMPTKPGRRRFDAGKHARYERALWRLEDLEDDDARRKVMDDESLQKEILKALEEAQPQTREMGLTVAKTLIETAEKILEQQKLEPLTKREKILLLGVASSITVQTMTTALSVLAAKDFEP